MFNKTRDEFNQYKENVNKFLEKELNLKPVGHSAIMCNSAGMELFGFGDGLFYDYDSMTFGGDTKADIADYKKAIEYYAFKSFVLFAALGALKKKVGYESYEKELKMLDQKFGLRGTGTSIFDEAVSSYSAPDYFDCGRSGEEYENVSLQKLRQNYCDYLWLKKKMMSDKSFSGEEEKKYAEYVDIFETNFDE